MQSQKKTVFERIMEGELPCEKIYEDEKVIAFKDIAPHAPVHILIVTKKVIPDLQSMEKADYPLLGHIVAAAQTIAKDFDLLESGYRLLVNNGHDAGQIVPHLHFHLLGGAPLNPI